MKAPSKLSFENIKDPPEILDPPKYKPPQNLAMKKANTPPLITFFWNLFKNVIKKGALASPPPRFDGGPWPSTPPPPLNAPLDGSTIAFLVLTVCQRSTISKLHNKTFPGAVGTFGVQSHPVYLGYVSVLVPHDSIDLQYYRLLFKNPYGKCCMLLSYFRSTLNYTTQFFLCTNLAGDLEFKRMTHLTEEYLFFDRAMSEFYGELLLMTTSGCNRRQEQDSGIQSSEKLIYLQSLMLNWLYMYRTWRTLKNRTKLSLVKVFHIREIIQWLELPPDTKHVMVSHRPLLQSKW